MSSATMPALLSVLGVSALSLVGVFTLLAGPARLRHLLPFLVALAAGALLGDAFLHLLPESVARESGFGPATAWGTLGGLLGFMAVENLIHWHHHGEDVDEHARQGVASFALMNLLGDALHNAIDGVLIAGTWIGSPTAGLATTVAVALHEIPQEFGDFGVLVRGGIPVRRALLLNALSAVPAILGAVATLAWSGSVDLPPFVLPVAAGGFLYVACADLIPEIHRSAHGWQRLMTALALVLGIALVAWLARFAPHLPAA